MLLRSFILFLLALTTSLGAAQPRLASSDTIAEALISPLTLDEYFQAVLFNHPVARQAYLLNELAQQDLRLAQGNFDPKLKSNFAIKQFGDKNTTYYNTWDSKLEIPLWFPMDLNVGYERNRGEYLNDELANTQDGLIYAGVTLPVGRGLLIDERRTAVRTARLMQDIAVADQIKEINKVLLNAAKAYWEWYYAYEAYQVINEVEQLAEVRYRGVVRRVENGDVAPFDSLKAFINYQERDVLRAQAALDYENTKLTASVYLWRTDDGNAIPLEIAENTVPVRSDSVVNLSLEDLDDLQRLARANHPEITKLGAKIQQLQIQQRLNREFLKPEINLKYNFLANSFNGDGQQLFNQRSIPVNGDGTAAWYENNYRAGVEFYFPLFLRKERAKLAQTTVKLEQNFFERSFVQRAIENEINTAYNTLYNLNTVIAMQQEMVRNYERLLQGELRKFEFGESSIFLINVRETELLDARVKLLKLNTQYEKAKLELQYAAGVPNLVLADN